MIECDTDMKHMTHKRGFTARSSGAPTKCAMRPILWDIEEISTFLDYSKPLRTSTLHEILDGLRESCEATATGLRDTYGLTLGLHAGTPSSKLRLVRLVDISSITLRHGFSGTGCCSESPHKRWSCEIPAVLEA